MGKKVIVPPEEAALLAEANRINYRLRSTFFYRKLKEYNILSLPVFVAELIPVEHLYSWDDRNQWGVGEDAFAYIGSNSNFHVFQVFCHPKLLREHPRLLAYYRNVAALSQKSVGYLVKAGVNIKKFESDTDNRFALNENQAFLLSRLEPLRGLVPARCEKQGRRSEHRAAACEHVPRRRPGRCAGGGRAADLPQRVGKAHRWDVDGAHGGSGRCRRACLSEGSRKHRGGTQSIHRRLADDPQCAADFSGVGKEGVTMAMRSAAR
jgi:hypothetical protein